MDKSPPERPNRVVTCQVCGVQMPQRYLVGHMQGHEQARAETLPAMPETALVQGGTPEPQTMDDVASEKQPSGMLICPACADFVAEGDFTNHMQAQHTNWCPLCQARTKDLSDHLKSKHLLKPIQPPPLYERSWETQKRFICLGCKKKVSVWSYPKHEGPHGATRGLAQRMEKTRPARVPPPAAENTGQAYKNVVCAYCQQEIAQSAFEMHLADEHPACPYCHRRQHRQELNDHIQTNHPSKRLPE